MNMYKHFKEHSVYDFHKIGDRFSISIVVSNDYESYLMISDLEEHAFIYGVLVLAEKTAKNFYDEAKHATHEIAQYYKKKNLVHH